MPPGLFEEVASRLDAATTFEADGQEVHVQLEKIAVLLARIEHAAMLKVPGSGTILNWPKGA
jgi:hypothetical protein